MLIVFLVGVALAVGAGEFVAQPEEVACFSRDTSFLSIDWYINRSIG